MQMNFSKRWTWLRDWTELNNVLDPFMLSHRARFYSVLWVSNINVFISTISLFIFLLMDIRVAIVHDTAMDVDVQISLWDPAFNYFGCIPRSGISESYGNSVFNFLRNHYDIFIVPIPLYIPSSSIQVCNSSTSLPAFVLFLFFW